MEPRVPSLSLSASILRLFVLPTQLSGTPATALGSTCKLPRVSPSLSVLSPGQDFPLHPYPAWFLFGSHWTSPDSCRQSQHHDLADITREQLLPASKPCGDASSCPGGRLQVTARLGTPTLLPFALQELLQPPRWRRGCSRQSQLWMQHPLARPGAGFPGLRASSAFTAQVFATAQHLPLRILRAESLVFHV